MWQEISPKLYDAFECVEQAKVLYGPLMLKADDRYEEWESSYILSCSASNSRSQIRSRPVARDDH